MQSFILLTRLVREEIHPSFSIRKRETDVVQKIHQYLPDVKWISNYVLAGPWDYLDIFEADNLETALKVSALVRYYGAAHAEVWPVITWTHFKNVLNELAQVMEK